MIDTSKIMFAIPTYDSISSHALVPLFRELTAARAQIGVATGALVHTARNHLAYEAWRTWRKDKRLTHIYWHDADMLLPPIKPDGTGILHQLMSHQLPVVSGLCFQGNGQPAVRGQPEGWVPPADGLYKVTGTGFACLLMEIDVLDQMIRKYRTPWFQLPLALKLPVTDDLDLEQVYNCYQQTGEDMWFSHCLNEMGIPIYVDCGANVGHLKLREINRSDHGRILAAGKTIESLV